jgi:hypothetical protein
VRFGIVEDYDALLLFLMSATGGLCMKRLSYGGEEGTVIGTGVHVICRFHIQEKTSDF